MCLPQILQLPTCSFAHALTALDQPPITCDYYARVFARFTSTITILFSAPVSHVPITHSYVSSAPPSCAIKYLPSRVCSVKGSINMTRSFLLLQLVFAWTCIFFADAIYTKNSPVLQVTAKSYNSLIKQSNHTSVGISRMSSIMFAVH